MADETKWDTAKRKYESAEAKTDKGLRWMASALTWMAEWKYTLVALCLLAATLLYFAFKILR